MPEVSVVIGNYQGERLLPDCLESLRRQTLEPCEVIVVDAQSTDRSREVAEQLGATVLATENRGVGWLYNLGARAARSELVLLANNDVAFDSRCMELLAAALEQDPRRFAADPCQRDWENRRVIHARSELRRGPLLREPLPGLRIDQNVPADRVTPTLLANGAAMLVRRNLLLELGSFDESYFMEFEELDVCWRAWLRGWETVYVPEAWLRHHVGKSTSTRRVVRRRVTSAHHNLLRFALKCLPPAGVARVVAGELLRLGAHPLLIAPALARVALELPEILRARAAARPTRALYEWFLAGQEGPAPTG